MGYVKWNDSLLVNVPEIDDQHRKLIGLINELHSAMTQGQGSEILGGIIDGLIDYTRVHFAAEEGYFDASAYPDAARHKLQHEEFVAKVTDFKRGFEEGRLMLSLDVMSFLGEWLVGHIQASDQSYAPYLAGPQTP